MEEKAQGQAKTKAKAGRKEIKSKNEDRFRSSKES
jgi:hypothetical protein